PADLAAFMTSSARISPPGPEPRKPATSTPCSRASRRPLGEMRISDGAAAPGLLATALAAPVPAAALSWRRPVCAGDVAIGGAPPGGGGQANLLPPAMT